jgi:hypothetical protein
MPFFLVGESFSEVMADLLRAPALHQQLLDHHPERLIS